MNFVKKFNSSVASTSVMTAFSYLFSCFSGANLKEPWILTQMTGRLMPWRRKKINQIDGWLIHYAVGLLFTELYFQFWKNSSPNSERRAGLIFGGIAGLAAILIWKFALTIHPFPPRIDFELFALNLFLGHIVFGLVSAFTLP